MKGEQLKFFIMERMKSISKPGQTHAMAQIAQLIFTKMGMLEWKNEKSAEDIKVVGDLINSANGAIQEYIYSCSDVSDGGERLTNNEADSILCKVIELWTATTMFAKKLIDKANLDNPREKSDLLKFCNKLMEENKNN